MNFMRCNVQKVVKWIEKITISTRVIEKVSYNDAQLSTGSWSDIAYQIHEYVRVLLESIPSKWHSTVVFFQLGKNS